RIRTGSRLEPGAVLGRDEPRERRAIMMRRDRSEAPAADDRDDRPLGLHLLARCGIVRSRDEMLLTRPYLQRQRTLPRLGEQLLDLEAITDLRGKAEPVQPARCEDDCVEPAL